MGKIHKLLKKLNEQLTGEQAGDEASAKAEIATRHLEQLKSGLADLQKKSPDLQKPLQSLLRNVSEYSAEDFKQRPPFVTFRDSWRVWLKQLMKDAPAADDADAFVSHAAEILAQAKALQMIDEVYGREGDWDDYRGASRDREDFGSDNISETMSTKSMDFDAWMSKVNAEVDKLSGMRADDLPDVAYRDWYDDGLAPSRAARRAIKNAEMGEDVGKPEGGNPAAALDEELSRKHYEAIAKILSMHKNWDDIVAALTDLFKSDNPRFSADEFKKAVNPGASQEEIEGVASSIRENIYDTLQEYRRENKYGMPWASLDKAIESHRDSAAELLKIDTGKKMSEADWKAIWEQTYKITRLTWSKDFNSTVGDPDAKEPKTEDGDDGKPSPSNSAPKTNPQINKDRAAADRDFEHDLHKGFKTPPPQHQAAFDAAYKRVAQGLTKWTRNV